MTDENEKTWCDGCVNREAKYQLGRTTEEFDETVDTCEPCLLDALKTYPHQPCAIKVL